MGDLIYCHDSEIELDWETQLRLELIQNHLLKNSDLCKLTKRDLDPIDALNVLSKNGLVNAVADGSYRVSYHPSPEAVSKLAENISSWSDALAKKAKKLEKSMNGAIFTFVGFEDAENIEVFITDWSPCPAACAIAIHPQHRFLKALDSQRKLGDYFTGKYVRHPLNGDLLPVWAADWVNPGFGTGAVLVNPAHSAVDYAFGKKVGLPMKFALHPEETTFSPDGWPNPTVIKEGRVVNNSAYDGLTWSEAATAYFDDFSEKGLARSHRDVRLPSKVVAKIMPADDGEYHFDQIRCYFGRASDGQGEGKIRVDIEFNPLIVTAAAFRLEASVELISANSKSKEELIYLASLYFDLTNQDKLGPNRIVGRVEGSSDRPKHILQTALLVCSDTSDVLVLNNKNVDQVKVFFEVLLKCRENFAEGGNKLPDTIISSAKTDPRISFKEACGWLKEAVKENKPICEDSLAKFCESILPVSIEDLC